LVPDMLRTIAVLLALVTGSTARADSVAHTCRAADNIKPIGKSGCIGFIAHDASGREVNRVANGYFISGSIYASPDGRSVAMLHHYPMSDDKFDTKDALVFFRDGKQLAKYSMRDLIGRMELVSASTSHYQWVADRPVDLELGKTLRLTTTSQRTLEFEVATGKLVSSDDTAMWKKCDVLAYAGQRISTPVNGVYTLEHAWLGKGKLPGGNGSKLSFAATKNVRVGDRSGVVLCLVPDKQHGWLAIDTLDTMWNQLPR